MLREEKIQDNYNGSDIISNKSSQFSLFVWAHPKNHEHHAHKYTPEEKVTEDTFLFLVNHSNSHNSCDNTYKIMNTMHKVHTQGHWKEKVTEATFDCESSKFPLFLWEHPQTSILRRKSNRSYFACFTKEMLYKTILANIC